MTQHELFQNLTETFADCLKIVEKKNQDYATGEDAFKNFRFASLVDVDPRRAILVRIADKLARISNLLDKEPEVRDESLRDSILDLINYGSILIAYITEDGKA